jgi:hypothetical protein
LYDTNDPYCSGRSLCSKIITKDGKFSLPR